MRSTFFQPHQKRRSVIQNSRSHEFNGGRGRFRLRTASCCRSAMTSSAVAARSKEHAEAGEKRKEEMDHKRPL